MSYSDVRGYRIDINKVERLAKESGNENSRSYHQRSLGMIENALAGGDLNHKQTAWLQRLEENVDNQFHAELGS